MAPAGLRPIRIRGFAARPASSGRLPAIAQAHALGRFSEDNAATSTATRRGLFVLADTSPRGGKILEDTSKGLRASGNRIAPTSIA